MNKNIKNKVDSKVKSSPYKIWKANHAPFEEIPYNSINIKLENGKLPSLFKYKGKTYEIREVGIEENESTYAPSSKFYKIISNMNKKIIERFGVNFFLKLTKINSKLDELSAKLVMISSSIALVGTSFLFGSAFYFAYNGKTTQEYQEFIKGLFQGISIKPSYVVGGLIFLYSYRKIKETVDLVQRVMVNDIRDELRKKEYDEKTVLSIIDKFKRYDEEERTANKGMELALSLGLSFLGPIKQLIVPIIMMFVGAKNNIKYEKKQRKAIEELGKFIRNN